MKKKTPHYVIPYDSVPQPKSTAGKDGHEAFVTIGGTEAGPSSIVLKADDAPAGIGAAEHNAALLREALVDLMAQGLVKSGTVEIPSGASTSGKMTLKEFKAAYANKPGATFYCPEHLKHLLEDE